jgi:putative hydrolase of HD superfamily
MEQTQKIIDFIRYAEGLKTEMRHATKSNGDKESVADHSWRLCLVLMLAAPKLKLKIDLLKALKMAIVHDIIEIEAKDIPILEQISSSEVSTQKEKNEKLAIENIKSRLGLDGLEIVNLWYEFEESKTNEARVVKALDKLEGQWQFLDDPIRRFTANEQESIEKLFKNTNKLCKVDSFLQNLNQSTLSDMKERTSAP